MNPSDKDANSNKQTNKQTNKQAGQQDGNKQSGQQEGKNLASNQPSKGGNPTEVMRDDVRKTGTKNQANQGNSQSAADTSAEVTGRNQSSGARGGSNQQRSEAGQHSKDVHKESNKDNK